jgi:hypothetical protein
MTIKINGDQFILWWAVDADGYEIKNAMTKSLQYPFIYRICQPLKEKNIYRKTISFF